METTMETTIDGDVITARLENGEVIFSHSDMPQCRITLHSYESAFYYCQHVDDTGNVGVMVVRPAELAWMLNACTELRKAK